MNSIPEEFAGVLERAEKEIETVDDSQQAIAVRTEKGNIYSFASRDVSEEGQAEESRFVNRLAELGESRMTALVCLWRDGALDVPSRHMVASLMAINAMNRETRVLLKGSEDSHVRLLGALIPEGAL